MLLTVCATIPPAATTANITGVKSHLRDLKPHDNTMTWYHDYPHFADEETEVEKDREFRTPGHRVRGWQSWVSEPYASQTLFLPPFFEEGSRFHRHRCSLPSLPLHLAHWEKSPCLSRQYQPGENGGLLELGSVTRTGALWGLCLIKMGKLGLGPCGEGTQGRGHN